MSKPLPDPCSTRPTLTLEIARADAARRLRSGDGMRSVALGLLTLGTIYLPLAPIAASAQEREGQPLSSVEGARALAEPRPAPERASGGTSAGSVFLAGLADVGVTAAAMGVAGLVAAMTQFEPCPPSSWFCLFGNFRNDAARWAGLPAVIVAPLAAGTAVGFLQRAILHEDDAEPAFAYLGALIGGAPSIVAYAIALAEPNLAGRDAVMWTAVIASPVLTITAAILFVELTRSGARGRRDASSNVPLPSIAPTPDGAGLALALAGAL